MRASNHTNSREIDRLGYYGSTTSVYTSIKLMISIFSYHIIKFTFYIQLLCGKIKRT